MNFEIRILENNCRPLITAFTVLSRIHTYLEHAMRARIGELWHEIAQIVGQHKVQTNSNHE